jgi:hypothetical protein
MSLKLGTGLLLKVTTVLTARLSLGYRLCAKDMRIQLSSPLRIQDQASTSGIAQHPVC